MKRLKKEKLDFVIILIFNRKFYSFSQFFFNFVILGTNQKQEFKFIFSFYLKEKSFSFRIIKEINVI